MPRLQVLFEKYKDKGFQIIAVDRMNDTVRAKQFIADNKLTYTMLQNGFGDREFVRAGFGVRIFPTSFLIDREGKVMFMHIGFDEGEEAKFEKEILTLLGD